MLKKTHVSRNRHRARLGGLPARDAIRLGVPAEHPIESGCVVEVERTICFKTKGR